MLFLHEVHKVVGTRTDEFEEAFRKGLMPALARGDDARLLWYSNHAMGSGVSYNVVTVTAVKDGAAWERLALRFQKGDLQGWVRDVDTLRHDAAGKLMLPLHWSPLQEIDFRSVPSDGREHALSLYMEDTMWPYREQYLRYIDTSGAVYSKSLQVADPFIKIEASFQPAFGSHVRREVMLMQKIVKVNQLRELLTHEIPIEQRRHGCTRRWCCATSGRAGCCAPRRGRRCIERGAGCGRVAAMKMCWGDCLKRIRTLLSPLPQLNVGEG